MMVNWVSQMLDAVRAPETAIRYRNAATAISMIPVIQLLIVPIQMALDQHGVGLPASILVMLLVTASMLVANHFNENTSSIYGTHLKGPVSVLSAFSCILISSWSNTNLLSVTTD
jgi:hypothetical protein